MFLKKCEKTLLKIESGFSMVLLIGLVVLVFVAALFRYAGKPFTWSAELAQLMFSWFTMACASVTWRADGHVSVNVLYRHFSPIVQRIIDLVNLIFIAAFLCLLSTNAVILAVSNWTRRINALRISYSWISVSIAVFGYIMLINTLFRIVKAVKNLKTKKEMVGEA